MSINRFFITTIFILGIPIFGLCQNFETLLSNIFFQADLSKNDTSILTYFAKDRRIVYSSEIEIWKNYKKKWYEFDDKAKRLSVKNPNSRNVHTFAFYTNPFFQPPFGKGYITVLTNPDKDKQEVSQLFLTISTYDLAVVDSTFHVLNSLFSKYIEPMGTIYTYIGEKFNQYATYRDLHKSREIKLQKSVIYKNFVPRVTLLLIIYNDRQDYLFIPRKKVGDSNSFKK